MDRVTGAKAGWLRARTAARRSAETVGSELVPWMPGALPGTPSGTPREEPIRSKEERWHEAWRRKQLGQSPGLIGREMGKSRTTIRKYIANWERLLAGSDRALAERDHQLATLSELEQRIWAEAQKGVTTWAAAAGPIRAVLADKRDLYGLNASGAPEGGEGVERPSVLGKAAGVVDELDARRRKAS